MTVQLMSRNTSQDIAEYFQYTFNTVLGVNVEIDPVECRYSRRETEDWIMRWASSPMAQTLTIRIP